MTTGRGSHEHMPQQHQPRTIDYPGLTDEMPDEPHDEMRHYHGNGLLDGKRALITGGDSGIGRAVAVAFAKEGADVALAYLEEHDDARHTAELVAAQGRRCVTLPGDLADPDHCRQVVTAAATQLDGLHVLVNNVAYQNPVENFTDITDAQWRRTFAVNIDSYHHVTRTALEYLPRGGAVVNTASINGLRGNASLIDYSASKGAVIAFTYALAKSLLPQGIRVNCVAPGPVWTPLIPATMSDEAVQSFGEQAPYGRAAQPDEIAPSYVFFAAPLLSSYYSGEVLAPIGGETLPG